MAQVDGVDDDVGIYTLQAFRTFPGTPDECREARLWARTRMRPFPDVADAVELVVSEFFGNAIRHSASGEPGGAVFISLVGLVSGALHLEVHDEGPRSDFPRTAARVVSPDLERSDGRGLFLAAALTKEWGRLPVQGGPGYAERGYTSIFDAVGEHEGAEHTGPMITWADFTTSVRTVGAAAAERDLAS
ncbi:ATP-binding protein [Streptomonospora wellingtoniae]|uniref:ATP-binding protein n=1 Tax=Streptomonospora wellingtoniae TaxID=3075544 RepID=A0ABU2KRA3_9ACTN|nr:ATP-binding protein [Streptomonospora sp. DSM 45055]MDT0301810.1 ATP-binding protein [Streptomonospora sp. DSM 45055]